MSTNIVIFPDTSGYINIRWEVDDGEYVSEQQGLANFESAEGGSWTIDAPAAGFLKILKKDEVNANSRPTIVGTIDDGYYDCPTELIEVLRKALLNKDTALDLSSMNLSAIPSKVYSITWLTRLDVSNNSITHIPSKLRKLDKLEYLNISNNPIDIHRDFINSPPDELLRYLDNKPAIDAIKHAKQKGAPRLDLNGFDLIDVPAELAELNNVSAIDLRHNKLSDLDSSIENCHSLRVLLLDDNNFKNIPPALFSLSKLEILSLDNNALSNIDKIYSIDENLIKLISRYIFLSKIRILLDTHFFATDSARQLILRPLIQSREIELAASLIKYVEYLYSPFNFHEILDLKDSVLRNPLDQYLTFLEYSTNRSLTEQDAKQIEEFYQIISVPSNQRWSLENVKETLTQVLPHRPCTYREIYSRLIESFCESETEEIQFEHDLDAMLINIEAQGDVSELLNNKTTKNFQLLLDNNNVSDVPRNIVSHQKLGVLSLRNNPIKRIPKTVIDDGLAGLQKYFADLSINANKREYLNEAKLVLVGWGAVGKTNIMEKLLNPACTLQNPGTTHGISIRYWNVKGKEIPSSGHFRFDLWDFGGQKRYDATHQLFITKRSFYLLVTDTIREATASEYDYWLNTIWKFGAASPVIVVMNKCDLRKGIFSVKDFKKKYTNIIDYCETSCVINDDKAYGIPELIRKIKTNIFRLPQTTEELPVAWMDIRRELEKSKEQQINYITLAEYLDICKHYGLNREHANYLSEVFHDLGVIIYFSNSLKLRDTMILNKEWCIDAIYRVLDDKTVIKNKGRFTDRDLKHIWSESKYKMKRKQLLNLMICYQFCFKFDYGDEYIAPELLPKDPPDFDWEHSKDNIGFKYTYDILPSGIMTFLIVKMHSWLQISSEKIPLIWKYGVVLKFSKSHALITLDEYNNSLNISITGEGSNESLLILIENVESIHKMYYENIDYEEQIRCYCDSCKTSKKPQYYDYRKCIKYKKSGKQVICNNLEDYISLSKLLYGIEQDHKQSLINQYTNITILDNSSTTQQLIETVNAKNAQIGEHNQQDIDTK